MIIRRSCRFAVGLRHGGGRAALVWGGSPLPAAAQQVLPYVNQHVAGLVEQPPRLVEPAGSFGAASRLPVFMFPIFDAGDQAGDFRN
jgi:hypothetical protein